MALFQWWSRRRYGWGGYGVVVLRAMLVKGARLTELASAEAAIRSLSNLGLIYCRKAIMVRISDPPR